MRFRYKIFFIILIISGISGSIIAQDVRMSDQHKDDAMDEKVNKTEEEWRDILTPFEFHVLREKGTERPYTGKYTIHKEDGTYYCAACGNPLFKSDTKYESGCGWPSFYEPLSDNSLLEKRDTSHGMIRTEVVCARCGSHLGHVFEDGPKPTGLRYCINSVSLDFEKEK